MKKIIKLLADNPSVFNILRRIVEFNHSSLKKAIVKEFSLDLKNGSYSADEKILDIPCGTGEFCTMFPPISYYGLDISEKYINYAQKKYKYKFLLRDAKESGFDSSYFDKILMLGFLHHLGNETVNYILKEAKRILKPDGMLLLIEDAPISTPWNIVGKFLMRFDIGSNIRPAVEYKTIVENDFVVKRFYNIKSGFFDYSVFVLYPNK